MNKKRGRGHLFRPDLFLSSSALKAPAGTWTWMLLPYLATFNIWCWMYNQYVTTSSVVLKWLYTVFMELNVSYIAVFIPALVAHYSHSKDGFPTIQLNCAVLVLNHADKCLAYCRFSGCCFAVFIPYYCVFAILCFAKYYFLFLVCLLKRGFLFFSYAASIFFSFSLC